MTAIEFAYWLNGALELGGMKTMSAEQVQIVKDHLALVLTKITPQVLSQAQVKVGAEVKHKTAEELLKALIDPTKTYINDPTLAPKVNNAPDCLPHTPALEKMEDEKVMKEIEDKLKEMGLVDPIKKEPDCLSGFFTTEQLEEAEVKACEKIFESLKKNNPHWNSGVVVCGSGKRYC